MKKWVRFTFILTLPFLADASLAQTLPDTSGQPSYYEPESNPHTEGDYHPNMRGQPKVGAAAKQGTTSTPFQNQIDKGSNPMANGK